MLERDLIELADVRQEIPVSAAAIWNALTDFAHPERLAPTIEHVTVTGEGVGAVRVIRSSRGLTIHEEVLESDAARYRFRYVILDSGDMPFTHVTSYRCTVVLRPVSDSRTEVRWRSEGTVDGRVGPIRDFLTALYYTAIGRIAEQTGARR